MASPNETPTCYADIGELGRVAGDIDAVDWPDAIRYLKAASRRVDRHTGRWFFQLEASNLDIDVLAGQRDFVTRWDLIATPTDLKDDADFDQTYATDLLAGGATVVLLGIEAPYYGFELRGAGLTVARKGLRATADWGWPRTVKSSGDKVLDDPLSAAATTLTVGDVERFEPAQTLRIETEQLFVLDKPTATTLLVARGVNGSTAASHILNKTIDILTFLDAVAVVTAGLASRLWRRRDTGFSDVASDADPTLEMGPLGDDFEFLLAPLVKRRVSLG